MKVLILVDARDRWMVSSFVRRERCAVRTSETVGIRDRKFIDSHDVVWVRSRQERLLRVLRGCATRIVNPPDAIAFARRRQVGLRLAAAAGVPVAHDYEGPLARMPFARAVIKRRHDDGRSRPRLGSPIRSSRMIYAQRFIDSDWEHKLYVVGDDVFAFVQRPTLVDPTKKSRSRVTLDPKLGAWAKLALRACGLTLGGVDFLDDAGQPRVTDINSNIGLHTFREGYPTLARHLRERP